MTPLLSHLMPYSLLCKTAARPIAAADLRF
jgi:hypothetical protein